MSILPEFYKNKNNLLTIWFQVKDKSIHKYSKTDTVWSFIRHTGKCPFFINWINSNIIYINDIIDNNEIISENIVFNKLKIKHNCIAELHILLKCSVLAHSN